MSSPPLTTTSYAVLGLLAVRPWSSYELTQQMDRSLGRVWPRAVSKLYEEPKKLTARGLARSAVQQNGQRTRTVYTITAEGRRALAEWLGQPGEGPALEFEQLLKVFFADNGTTADLLATLAAAQAWARARCAESLARSPSGCPSFSSPAGSSPTSTCSLASGPAGRPPSCRPGPTTPAKPGTTRRSSPRPSAARLTESGLPAASSPSGPAPQRR